MNRRGVNDWLTAWGYAHRGLHSPGVPENSLAAAEAAVSAGMGIECDIQRSRDDKPMVFHDWELDRLTGRTGRTEDLDACELESLRLLDTDETPVRFERFLEAVAGRVPILVEIKSRPGYDIARTCGSVADLSAGYGGPLAIMSFDPRVPQWFAEHFPAIPRGLVGTDTLDNGYRGAWRQPEQLERAQPDFLALDIRDLPDSFAQGWRAEGRPLLTWTIRSPALRERALAHADGVIAEGEGLA